MIKTYKKAAVDTPKQALSQLLNSERGRSKRGAKTLLLEEIDKKVIAVIKNMRSAGTVVSYDITISIAKGLILANDRTLLKESGGNIDLTTSWAH